MKVRELENYRLRLYNVKEQLKRHVYERTRESCRAGREQRDGIVTADQLRSRQTYIRETFLQSIGGLPEPDRPLRSVVAGSRDCGCYRIERILFASRPGVWVTANLYLPSGSGPHPAVLFLCGHHDEGKCAAEYQEACQHLVRAGLAVLAIDPPGQGERLQYVGPQGKTLIGCGVYEHDYAGAQCYPLGDSLARYFVSDAMAAVDYLCGRPDIDSRRIGVTGNSGGGMQTGMLMMADSRLAAAAPATFITSREAFLYADRSQDAEQVWPGFSAAGLDHEDILLAMAPRPVLVIAAAYDFFPIEGTMETVRRVQRFWGMYGAGERIGLYIDKAVHAFTANMAIEAARFFAKCFGSIPLEHGASPVEPVGQQQLWCTSGGQLACDPVYGANGSMTLHDEIAERAAKRSGERNERNRPEEGTAFGGQEGLLWLQDRVYADRSPCDLNPRLNMLETHIDEMAVSNAVWWSQAGIFNHAMMFRDIRREGEMLPVTIALWSEGTACLQPHWSWIRGECAQGRVVLVLDVSGSGVLLPHSMHGGDPYDFYEVLHKLASDLYWLGDSLVAMRTYDVLRAVSVLPHLPAVCTEDLRLYGSGPHGLYACLAAALDDRLQLQWHEPLESIQMWVQSKYYDSRDIHSLILPGMLRELDLPELRSGIGMGREREVQRERAT